MKMNKYDKGALRINGVAKVLYFIMLLVLTPFLWPLYLCGKVGDKCTNPDNMLIWSVFGLVLTGVWFLATIWAGVSLGVLK